MKLLADTLRDKKTTILDRWEKRVRKTQEPRNLSQDELRDHIPALLEEIADLLDRTPNSPDPEVHLPRRLACDHADHRHELGFTLFQLVHEYGLLRETILSEVYPVMAQLGEGALVTLNKALDQAITFSVDRYSHQTTAIEQRLVGIVSHDLRNPIAAITTGASLLLRRLDAENDPRQARVLVRILSSAGRAERMINELLDLTQARLGGGVHIETSPVDLHAVVQQVLDEIMLAHPDARIVIAQHDDVRAELDADRVAQVITNLVINGLKHSAPGEPVHLETRGTPSEVELLVRNKGLAISTELLPHIFDPLKRGPEVKGTPGLGLGLFIVRHIVEAHGGCIDVRSSGDTTEFHARFPRQSLKRQ